MEKSILVLPSGREISSGVAGVDAIASITLTQWVNSGQELTPGGVCAAELQAQLITPAGDLQIAAGEELILLREDESGERYPVGIFLAEKPEHPTANTMRLTAYDRVTRLDKDLTGWLAGLHQWPYTLGDFADMVCGECGLELAEGSLPNEDLPIQAFSAQGITGRKLLEWVGQIAGRFCRATANGQIEFAWYAPNPVVLTADGDRYFYQNGLEFADYTVAPIEKVQWKLTEDDVGAVWPQEEGAYNTLVLEGNYLLTGKTTQELIPLAQSLFQQLGGISYTPCKVEIPACRDIQPGDIVTITDGNGRSFTTYLMGKTTQNGRDTLESLGSSRRDSVSTVNEQSYKTLNGKLMELRKNTDGLLLRVSRVETDTGKTAQGLADTNTALTQLRQSADDLTLSVQHIQENGAEKVVTATGFTFDETGMTVEKTGRDVKTQITENGMTVFRGGQEMLVANAQGVLAKDLNAQTYLIVGGLSRLENYNGRTGCFWIGGN